MLTPTQAKRLFADFLLTIATDKLGMADVITGRADALEPPIDDSGCLCAFKHYSSAMELGSVEDENEESIGIMGGDPHHHADILGAADGDAWREDKRYRGFWN